MVKNSFLLDTHVFIWAMEASKRLPKNLKNEIANPANRVFVSVSTIWEIVIKKKINKIKISFDLETSVKKAGLGILPIQISHVLQLEKLPLHHKDPFDRILIAQAQTEKLTIITHDPKFKNYQVKLFS